MREEFEWDYNDQVTKELVTGTTYNDYRNSYNMDEGFFCDYCGTRIIPVEKEMLKLINKALDGKLVFFKTVYKTDRLQSRERIHGLLSNDRFESSLSTSILQPDKINSKHRIIKGTPDLKVSPVEIECEEYYQLPEGFSENQKSINKFEFIETNESSLWYFDHNKEIICPICNKKTSEVYSYNSKYHRKTDESLVGKRLLKNKQICKDEIENIKEEAESSAQIISKEAKNIDIIPYLEFLIKLEKDIMIFTEQYELVRLMYTDAKRRACGERLKIKSVLQESIRNTIKEHEESINKHKEEIEEIELSFESEKRNPPYKNANNVTPEEYGYHAPEEPTLIKENIFNRKRAEEKNREIQEQYKEKLDEFQKLWSAKKTEIINEISLYNTEIDKSILRKEKQICKEIEDKRALIDSLQTQIEGLKTQLETLDNQTPVTVIQKSETFWSEELEEIKNKLYEVFKTRKEFLNLRIIHPKYQDIIPYTMFLDYFSTGRVSVFEGHEGAYNLYEQEIRANIVISQLNKVLDTLEEIKQNQYSTYEVLSSIQKDVSSLEKNVGTAVGYLEKISNNVENIKESTEIIAYNSAKTAYYSKLNAELTDAMGFLIALK